MHIFHVCLRRLGVPPRPPLTEIEDRRACDSDRRVTVNNIQVEYRLYSSTAAPVTGAGVSVPRHKVQARHDRYSEIRNPSRM
jgi:hypothetical protein